MADEKKKEQENTNAQQVFSLPIGNGFNMDFYLDEEGNPVFATDGRKVEDPNLLAAITQMVDEMEEQSAKTIQVGNQILKYILDKEGKPVTLKEHQAIHDPMLLRAIHEDLTKGSNDIHPGMLGDGGNGNVAENFRGLPMRDLIGGPLFAAAEAQEKLASIAWDYYQRIGFEDGGGEGDKKTQKARILEFNVERPVVLDGVTSTQNIRVQAPFIGLVPIPSLLIDRVDVDFQMEVTDTNAEKSETSAEVSTNISSKWFGVKVEVSGKVSTSRENTRSTNQTAKYQVHVSASQQPQTEGLSKLMDIMASCIEPIPTDNGGGGGGGEDPKK